MLLRVRAVALAAALSSVPLAGCDCAVEPLEATKPQMALPDELDFGPIGEGTSVTQPITLQNDGDGELDVTVSLDPDGSADFAIDGAVSSSAGVQIKLAPHSSADVTIRFSPVAVGEDASELLVTGNDGDGAVHIHGGPIEPSLQAPASVDFAPADASIVAKTVVLTNVGLAKLHIESTAPDAAANPQFAAPTAPFDVDLAPQESASFDVTYTRSARQDHGRLLVRSNDPADAAGGGVRAVDLVPDYLRQCEDGVDNDTVPDGLVDFPNDPGCSDPHDDSEDNAAECVPTATRPCGNGVCAGIQTCSDAGIFGACDGDDSLATTETCNGVDDDCDGTRDNDVAPVACTVASCPGHQTCVPNSTTPGGEPGICIADDPNCTAVLCGNGTVDQGEECDHGSANNGVDGQCSSTCTNVGGTCDPSGVFTLAAPVSYSCCFGTVDQSFSTISIAPGGTASQGDPDYATLVGNAAVCPSGGAFTHRLQIFGGCDETYTLTGVFDAADHFSGTYQLSFTGSQCDCFGAAGQECTSTTFPVDATR